MLKQPDNTKTVSNISDETQHLSHIGVQKRYELLSLLFCWRNIFNDLQDNIRNVSNVSEANR